MAMLQGEIGPESGVGVTFGVPFGSQQISESVGRRIAVREFAGRDEPGTQDLGRAARRYRIQAVLLGPDYVNLYNDLVEELERPGRKRLRHPIHGDRIVRIPVQEVSMSLTSAGRADVAFDVIEAGPREPLLFILDDISTSVAGARTARDLDADKRINLLNRIQDFAEDLVSKVAQANSELRGVKHAIDARLNVVDDLAHQIDQLDDNIKELLDKPGQIANAFGNLVKQVMDLATTATDAAASPPSVVVDAAAAMVEFGAADPQAELNAVVVPTPDRDDYDASIAGITDMVRASAVIEVAAVLPDLDFDSAEQVRDTRSRVAAMVDTVLGSESITPDLYDAISTVWATLENILSQQSQDLPRVIKWLVPETMPALLIAHHLYGDARRADEIIARNRTIIANPCFVPGGVEIEVLAR